MKPIKPKTCRICKAKYTPRASTQVVCSPQCAIELVKRKSIAKERTEKRLERVKTKKAIDSIKTLTELANEAQFYVNKYVRLRDEKQGCISCDKDRYWHGQWHASHLKSRGANSALRFHLWNIHKACSVCNNYLSGNVAEFERRLRVRIGDDKVDYLNSHERSIVYDRDYLIRLKKVFIKMCKRKYLK